jgi:hypothetical protein
MLFTNRWESEKKPVFIPRWLVDFSFVFFFGLRVEGVEQAGIF